MMRAVAGQTGMSVLLAAALLAGWLVLHVAGVFLAPLDRVTLIAAPVVILVQAWLSAGLFIVAHDCMHGSFAPGRPGLNRAVGTLCVALYACFSYRQLEASHFRHHRHAGREGDPDFNPADPHGFLRWYLRFFANYYTHGQILRITLVACVYIFAFGAELANIALFWAVPALLSSLQLFAFGTWLPHRHDGSPFADRHNARSNRSGWIGSLLSCFHFGGYHHEHHLHPGVPWWALPQASGAMPKRAA
jgi:beta-carotene ketolase (CrtW type)